MLLGSDQLSQLYEEENPHTDVLTKKRQQENELVIGFWRSLVGMR